MEAKIGQLPDLGFDELRDPGRNVRGCKRRRRTMGVLSKTELSDLSRNEPNALLRKIAKHLPMLLEGLIELRNAHASLHNIRYALTWLTPAPRL